MTDKIMFNIRNGIMYENNCPVISLGVSYYPSYHPQKVPVQEGADRDAEMVKDLKQIKAAGFNTVRCAAIGKIERNESEITLDFSFIDRMLLEAEEAKLGFLVRLQGYDMILGDYKDGLMQNSMGDEIPFTWHFFVRNCINNPMVIDDNKLGTKASADHFSSFKAVMGYQVYNEPAYPCERLNDKEYGLFCYNPYTIEAYKRWLEKNGYEVKNPPKTRDEQDIEAWKRWRNFSIESLNNFLCEVGSYAKEFDTSKSVFTCYMPCPIQPENAIRGDDYFIAAQGMDILGITTYLPCEGDEYLTQASLNYDFAESIAALFGKKAWTVECNGGTRMTVEQWERETYAILGSGHKGIHYYQWRADYPLENSPEPQLFGVVWSDGQRTDKFDGVLAMNSVVNEISADLALSNKVRSNVAILYSNNTMVHEDAVYGSGENMINCIKSIYKYLIEKHIVVDFVRSCDLKENPLNVKLLIIPTIVGLDETELANIKKFEQEGNMVLIFNEADLGQGIIDNGIEPIAECDCEIDIKMLEGNTAKIMTLVNYREKEISEPFSVTIKSQDYAVVEMLDTCGRKRLDCEYNCGKLRIIVPYLKSGAFILIHK